jgi:hypothetical protein
MVRHSINLLQSPEEENNGWSVKLHDHTITTVYGKNKKISKFMAAKNAVEIFTASPTLIYSICDCRNQATEG